MAAPEQFCLKWNNFQTSILTAFESLQATEDLTDVTLTCQAISVKAHKFILSACSPYFRSVFKDNPCSHPIVILKDVLYEDMLAVLNFMYHGEVLIAKDQLQSFLQTAELLQVTGLNSLPEKKKYKRPSEPDSNQKRAKIATPTNDVELVCVDNIKVEVDEGNYSATSEEVAPACPSSLLEAALESNKEGPSILERSLTQSSVKSPVESFHQTISEKIKELYIPRKPPDEEDRVKMETVDMTESSQMSNESSPANLQDVQPHHSSQCGNCPHCGKIYSNQSALKYHVRLVHSDFLNVYCCHLCPLTFDFRDCYKKHMVDAHSIRS